MRTHSSSKLDLPEVPKGCRARQRGKCVLTTIGERKLEKAGQRSSTASNVRMAALVRSFVLPDNVDPTKVTASMKDGVLEVRLSKGRAKPNQKQIEISVN